MGCEPMTDHKKILGSWSIRKDSSVMQVRFSPDSVTIGYLPERSRFAFSYMWKEDEDKGLVECYEEIPLDSTKQAVKIITSSMYVLHLSDDSLTLFIPRLKTQFHLARDKK
jgi:hypothetical protein